MREIALTQGQVALIDDEDYARLTQFKWAAHKQRSGFYAVRSQYIGKGKYKTIPMHKEVFSIPDGLVYDHINHDTLDNRRSNLRAVTVRQNLQNRKNCGTSKYPGVRWHKDNKSWIAQLFIGRKCNHLGSYKTEEEAFAAYCKALDEIGEPFDCSLLDIKEGE